MTVPVPVTLAVATPDRTWHTEPLTLWTDGEPLDHDTLEAEAIAAWVGADPRTDAVHLWLMDEQDDDWPEDAGIALDRRRKQATAEDDLPL
jgi:hypothetical protein